MKFPFSLPALALLVLCSCGRAQPPQAAAQPNTTAQAETTPVRNVESNSELAGGMTIGELDARYEGAEKAYFAGGCFWCTEASFHRIQGVKDVWSGYAGGTSSNPTYRQVAGGQTDYAEAIVVYYDPEVVTYETLLDVFFVAHDPTQVNRQGPDVGTQYRSAIFPLDEAQELAARQKINELNEGGKFDKPIATKIESADAFYVAEDYHQDYYEDSSNPNWGYVTNVSRPKVEKVKKVFHDILKEEYR